MTCSLVTLHVLETVIVLVQINVSVTLDTQVLNVLILFVIIAALETVIVLVQMFVSASKDILETSVINSLVMIQTVPDMVSV